ncbi:MAG: GNAT family N-acetyltransferase [Acidimicrobiales bacterium]|nr:GNAT family N-acetyltransferase [Acidimicrobiales bacterium]
MSSDLPTEPPSAERAFYIQEFARATLVVTLDAVDADAPDVLAPVVSSLAVGDARLVLVVGTDDPVSDADSIESRLAAAVPGRPLVHPLPDPPGDGRLDEAWMAELWLSVLDHGWVAVTAPTTGRSITAARLAAALRALKLVVTDEAGGWGRPPRSFADVSTHRDAYHSQLGERQGGAVVEAIETALAGGVVSVNLCRAVDIDRELFTFDGAGTLFTSGGYVEVVPLSVDDLAAVEDLVAQGTADGLLRPRSRREVARLAVGGLGAKVVSSGHLAGLVGLDTDAYRAEGLGEVAGLYTVSRFSGSGAGGLLIDRLVENAHACGLRAVFAVTVSDLAADFFVRHGFHEVDQDAVPASKWESYDAGRRAVARVFWHDTSGAGF